MNEFFCQNQKTIQPLKTVFLKSFEEGSFKHLNNHETLTKQSTDKMQLILVII